MEDIKKALQSCTSIAELVKTAHELKDAGRDVLTVNNELAKCRKQLLQRLVDIRRIPNESINAVSLDMNATTPISVSQLGKPIITVTESIVLI